MPGEQVSLAEMMLIPQMDFISQAPFHRSIERS
jgi:hypothetical protein